MSADRFTSVLRAGRVEAASSTDPVRQRPLIETDQHQKEPGEEAHPFDRFPRQASETLPIAFARWAWYSVWLIPLWGRTTTM